MKTWTVNKDVSDVLLYFILWIWDILNGFENNQLLSYERKHKGVG